MASRSEMRGTGVVQFGPFELNRQSGELRKQGIRIRLQPKPLQILYRLIEVPGAIVTREELQSHLWPEDTFVDFESGVNTAVNRLRLALGDSAEHPRYIETVSRLGYRFMAPLTGLAEIPSPVVVLPAAPSEAPPPPRRLRRFALVGSLAVIPIALTAAIWLHPIAPKVRYRQVTFRRGQVSAARFLANQEGIVYSAQWDAEPRRLYQVNSGSPASRPLGFENLGLAAVSHSGDLALLRSGGTMNITGGTLSRVAIAGGPTQQIASNIFGADWSSDGDAMAIVRVVAGAQQLEFPIGNILYHTSGWLSSIRVSPTGDRVAFIEHPVRHDDAGDIRVADRSGKVSTLCGGWSSAAGLVWRSSSELWFTAARENAPRSVWAVDNKGSLRAVGQTPGILTLRDLARDGRALFTQESRRLEIAGALAGDPAERDFSLTDWSRVQQLSSDGSLLLFDESGEGAGWRPVVYLRRIRSEETVRLREGNAQGFMPGDNSVLILDENRTRLWVAPVGGGPEEQLPPAGLTYQWARPFPSGTRLLVLANLPQQPLRVYIQDVKSGATQPLTEPMMVRNAAISNDGKAVAILTPEGKLLIYPADNGTQKGPVRTIAAEEPLAPIRWSRDGRSLFVVHLRSSAQSAADVSRIDLATGRIQLWKKLKPRDPNGVNSITGVTIADDEESYAYSYRRVLADLYIAEGWK